jgi:uncharacterized membrane protein YphA (DoxX/SURF4 family)
MSSMAVELALGAVLGLVFMASAVPKLRHPRGFVLAVLEYRVLPPRLSRLYARLVPPLEFLVALLMLTGTAVRSAAAVMSVLLLSFIVAIGINMARGRDLDCHCFGRATTRTIGWRALLQDVVLLGAAMAVIVLASEWVAPAPWSVFHIAGLAQAGWPVPLLGCVAVTTCAATLLGRSADGRRKYDSLAVSK